MSEKGQRVKPIFRKNLVHITCFGRIIWNHTDWLSSRKTGGVVHRSTSYEKPGTRRAVVALDAATGELLWVHSEHEGARAAASARQLSGRGLSYWTDGKGDDRIVYVTTGYRLVCLDAKTGQPVKTFGGSGTTSPWLP